MEEEQAASTEKRDYRTLDDRMMKLHFNLSVEEIDNWIPEGQTKTLRQRFIEIRADVAAQHMKIFPRKTMQELMLVYNKEGIGICADLEFTDNEETCNTCVY